MKHNSFPLHKLPGTENTSKLVPVFLNVEKVQGDKLLRLVVISSINQMQVVEMLVYSIRLDN